MTERHFPDDHEIDQWIASRFLDDTDTDPNPVADQLKAAAADSVNRFNAAAPGLVAVGLAEWAFTGDTSAPADRAQFRGVARQVIAAESVGILHLCPHTQLIRPQLLICDPPVQVCAACFTNTEDVIEKLGHLWNHECDRCGVHAQTLAAATVGGLGHIAVAGHICSACAADDRRLAAQHADTVVVVKRGNRRTRRRGGAR
jgi:hypothetical protein